MTSLFLSLLLGCASADAGDLWLDLDVRGSDTIALHLPANWLTEATEPVEVETASGTIDLAAEARALKGRRVGSKQSWSLKKEGTLSLRHDKLDGVPADHLALQTRGPKGGGLTVTMELAPQQIGQATGHLDGVIDVDGVKVDLDEALCAQLKETPPVTLVETTGPKGGGILLRTE